MSRPRTPYRAIADSGPPPPQAPRPGRSCWHCDHRATRRVRIGIAAPIDVCLWHSLVAQQMRNARLVRDLTASP